MKISVEGRREFAAKLSHAARDSQSEMDRERKRSAEHLLSVSIPVTPLSIRRYPSDPKPGELRESGYVDHTTVRGTSSVGFSAPKAPYVHEMGEDDPDDDPSDDPDGQINWSTPGTGAKFLEGPFAEWKPVYARNMKAAAIRGLHDR